MNLSEILEKKKEITYSLFVTRDSNHWFQIGKTLSSKNKVLAALRKSASFPSLEQFEHIAWVTHANIITSECKYFTETI